MAEKTAISWADSTFNPWIGCTKVGPGCDHCYAAADFDTRRKRVKWGAGEKRIRTSAAYWAKPLKWQKESARFFAEHGRRRRVFCASLADVFDNEAPPEWRVDLMRLIAQTPMLDWLLLTKRIGNALVMLDEAVSEASNGQFGWIAGNGYQRFGNVWIGATVCDHHELARDMPKLLAIPASVRFLSIEPMLGDINLMSKTVDWVICGGESGQHARPMQPEWVERLKMLCDLLGVPFFFKQWGGAGRDKGGCLIDGVERKTWPVAK